MLHLLLAAWLVCGAAHAGSPAVDWGQVRAFGSSLPELDAPPSVPGEPVLSLHGYLSLWSQDCSPDCGLPVPLLKNDPVELALPIPQKPGEFRSARVERSYPVSGGVLKVRATFYALFPTASPNAPAAAPYFNVQVELSGAVSAECGTSLNAADLSPFPVLTCGAPLDGRRLGVTLHRAPLP
jgi:hypothetical protein